MTKRFENRNKGFKPYSVSTIDGDGFVIGIQKEDGKVMSIIDASEMLNEQQATIDKLDQENADLLGARIKAQEEWEKCTDKLKAKILEQQATINKLSEENEQLRQSIEDYKDHNGELEFEIKQCRTKNKELQDKIDKIVEELDQYRYDETLYAKEIVKLNNEVKEVLKFKTLGGDY